MAIKKNLLEHRTVLSTHNACAEHGANTNLIILHLINIPPIPISMCLSRSLLNATVVSVCPTTPDNAFYTLTTHCVKKTIFKLAPLISFKLCSHLKLSCDFFFNHSIYLCFYFQGVTDLDPKISLYINAVKDHAISPLHLS